MYVNRNLPSSRLGTLICTQTQINAQAQAQAQRRTRGAEMFLMSTIRVVTTKPVQVLKCKVSGHGNSWDGYDAPGFQHARTRHIFLRTNSSEQCYLQQGLF